MIGAAILSLFAQAMAASAAPTVSVDLTAYRDIVYSLQWTNCCARFSGGVSDRIIRRVEAAERALGARHGAEAVRRENEAALAQFNEEFGLYDPAPQPENVQTRRAARQASMRWYDSRLDRLEARLGLARQ